MDVCDLGTHDFPLARRMSPYHLDRILTELFPHLCDTAAEDMEGDLPSGVVSTNRAAGPAYAQLFLDEVTNDRCD